jgi:intracellular septation protein
VIVTVFGGAALVFHNAVFAYVKPTVIYLLFAVGIFGSLAIGQNVWKLLLAPSLKLELSDAVWRTYAIRWGFWFVAMAILNVIVWRSFSESVWANFKLFGFLPLTALFAAANMPLLLKHSSDPSADKKAGAAE